MILSHAVVDDSRQTDRSLDPKPNHERRHPPRAFTSSSLSFFLSFFFFFFSHSSLFITCSSYLPPRKLPSTSFKVSGGRVHTHTPTHTHTHTHPLSFLIFASSALADLKHFPHHLFFPFPSPPRPYFSLLARCLGSPSPTSAPQLGSPADAEHGHRSITESLCRPSFCCSAALLCSVLQTRKRTLKLFELPAPPSSCGLRRSLPPSERRA